jgi:hypothetical protein
MRISRSKFGEILCEKPAHGKARNALVSNKETLYDCTSQNGRRYVEDIKIMRPRRDRIGVVMRRQCVSAIGIAVATSAMTAVAQSGNIATCDRLAAYPESGIPTSPPASRQLRDSRRRERHAALGLQGGGASRRRAAPHLV